MKYREVELRDRNNKPIWKFQKKCLLFWVDCLIKLYFVDRNSCGNSYVVYTDYKVFRGSVDEYFKRIENVRKSKARSKLAKKFKMKVVKEYNETN